MSKNSCRFADDISRKQSEYFRGLRVSPSWLLTLVFVMLVPPVNAGQDLGDLGQFDKWSKVEIDLQGPDSIGLSTSANPFEINVDVTFNGPGSQTFVVPAFYDGDGNGGMNGDVWRVRFSPSAVGSWSFASTSSNSVLSGYTGTFTVAAVDSAAQHFARWGRLEYVDAHYLKFADGPFWLKGGADEPEDFLGPGVMGDWNGKKAEVDYLSSKGVNSMYIMLHNVGGDGRNVWPWVSSNDSDHFDVAKLADWEDLFLHVQSKGIVLHLVFEDDSGWTGFNRPRYYREMIARFGHHNGLYWNISEEYNENYTATQVKGFAQQITDLDAYGHPLTVHNQGGLAKWSNFLGDSRFDLTSFQTNQSPHNQAVIDWRENSAAAGRPWTVSLDEYGRIGPNDRDEARKIFWSAYMGGGMTEVLTSPISSFQDYDSVWNDLVHARSFIEALPFWEMAPDNSLLSGGSGRKYCFAKPGEVYAVYLETGGSISLDLSGVGGTFNVRWFEPKAGSYTPDGTVSGGSVVSLGSAPFSGDAAVLVEIPSGNQTPVAAIGAPQDLQTFAPGESVSFSSSGSFDPDGSITAYHWNFGDGATSTAANPTHSYSTESTFTVSLEVDDDAGARSPPDMIQVVVSSSNVSPNASDQSVATVETAPAAVTLQFTDPDGPGPYDYTIESGPSSGVLSGAAPNLIYTANPGFAGSDGFTWSVNDGLDDSNVASVSVSVTDNLAPVAQNFSLSTFIDNPLDFSFGVYTSDPDGPGPYSYSVVSQPAHGQLTGGSDNDRTYTPDPGFSGQDSFSWQVFDGFELSNVAVTTIDVGEILFQDDFNRLDSSTVGNGWIEVESLSESKVEGSVLVFDALDDAHRPLVRNSFASQSNGRIIATFDLNFDRVGGESTYGFWMQLGDGSVMSDASPEDGGVAVNLKWASPSEGLSTHEGFGYVVDGIPTQIATVSGPAAVTVEADLDSQTYSVGVAGQLVENVPFENPVSIDTVRFFSDLLNLSNFPSRDIDNVAVRQESTCLAPGTLDLSQQTVNTTTEFTACGTITAGDSFAIVTPGDVTFRTRGSVSLTPGFSVGSGATFRVILDPSAGVN